MITGRGPQYVYVVSMNNSFIIKAPVFGALYEKATTPRINRKTKRVDSLHKFDKIIPFCMTNCAVLFIHITINMFCIYKYLKKNMKKINRAV